MDFSQRLRDLRTKSKLNQTQLAKFLDVGQRQISYYESGKDLPPLNTLIMLSNFFAVSLDYLTGRDDDPQYEKYLTKTEESILCSEAVYFVPDKYKDLTQRVENYSIEDRQKILFILYAILDNHYETRSRHKEAMEIFKPTLYNEFLKQSKYLLQKTGLMGPTVYAAGGNPEEHARVKALFEELKRLLNNENER